jgi:hypothetical protein
LAPDLTQPLYRRVLGSDYARLPQPLQDLHELIGSAAAEGRARVERGRNPLAWLIGFVVGFPAAAHDVPIRVEFRLQNGVETWRRIFDGKAFDSTQEQGQGAFEGVVVERFGPIAFGLQMVVEEARMRLVLRRWTMAGVPLPLWLGPRPRAFEDARDDRFNFHVEIGHPLVGMIVRYRGWLGPLLPA